MKNHALLCIFLTLAVCYGKPSQVQELKKLPIDTSSFKTLIEYDYLYVDKTKSIHSLIQAEQNYFLVRPRRFGRTLFLSTLKEIFSGHKELFKDCWIGGNSSKYDWPVHPVISLNFLMINDQSPDELEASLIRNIQDFAEEYDIYLDKNLSLEHATTGLIKKLSSQDKVVLLIDEYDRPLRKHQLNKENADKIEQVLKRFYTIIGRLNDHFRAIIITGVVPYSASMLFSSIPNLKNISFSPEAKDLCGFTEEEINTKLLPYVEQYAQHLKKSTSEVLQEMQELYGGHRFTQIGPVLHSPIPTMYHLRRMEKDSHLWLETSTSTFLFQCIKTFPSAFSNQESWNVLRIYGENCEVGELTPTVAFWYSGFLTLDKNQPNNEQYNLISPNQSTNIGLKALISKHL